MISGWLLYPFDGIDIFQPEWKIPKEYLLIDAGQINTILKNPSHFILIHSPTAIIMTANKKASPYLMNGAMKNHTIRFPHIVRCSTTSEKQGGRFLTSLTNKMIDCRSVVKHTLKEPYYIWQKDYDVGNMESLEINGNRIYFATEDEVNSYHVYPGTCYEGMLERSTLIGDKIEDGDIITISLLAKSAKMVQVLTDLGCRNLHNIA